MGRACRAWVCHPRRPDLTSDNGYSEPVVAGWRALWFDIMQYPVETIRRAKAAYFAAVNDGAGPIEAAEKAKRLITN